MAVLDKMLSIVWDDEHIESEPDSPWHSSIAHSRRRVYSVRHEQKCQALKKEIKKICCDMLVLLCIACLFGISLHARVLGERAT